MGREDDYPLRTVGWGPFTLPGERKRMQRLKEKYDTLAEQFDREAAAAQDEPPAAPAAPEPAAGTLQEPAPGSAWKDELRQSLQVQETYLALLRLFEDHASVPQMRHRYSVTPRESDEGQTAAQGVDVRKLEISELLSKYNEAVDASHLRHMVFPIIHPLRLPPEMTLTIRENFERVRAQLHIVDEHGHPVATEPRPQHRPTQRNVETEAETGR